MQSSEASLPTDTEAILAAIKTRPGGAPAFNEVVTKGLVESLAKAPELFPQKSKERSHLQAYIGELLSDVGPDESCYCLALPLLTSALEEARAAAGGQASEDSNVPALKALCALGTLQVRREELKVAEPLLLKVRQRSC